MTAAGRSSSRHPPVPWRRSSRSSPNATCVELAEADGGVIVRNSNRIDDGVLRLSRAELAALVGACRSGALDSLAYPEP